MEEIKIDEVKKIKIQNALLFLWSECVLDVISAKTYKIINENFENKLKKCEGKNV